MEKINKEILEKTKTFKNSSGQLLLKALFYETNQETPDQVIYTLKDHDHKGYPSLYRLYLETEDETEYEFANRYLFSWEHWKRLSESNLFKETISRWREELKLKLLARHLEEIKLIADGNTKDSFAARKYLIERGWIKKPPVKRAGRPNKTIEGPDTRALNREITEDMERIGAGVPNGRELN